MSEVKGKVARIISEHELAINVGGDHGLQVGDKAALYRTVDVNDPDSGEILGSVEVRTLGLEVSIVEPRFCVAVVTDRQSTSAPVFMQVLQPLKKITSTRPRTGSTAEVFVAVGDIVHFDDDD
ncbi:FlgT C-terminal domain-containing protein [Micromonospora chalcea]